MTTSLPSRRSLACEIQHRRTSLGLTQAALAEKVAAQGDWTIRQSDISRLERGVITLPHQTRLQCLAAALELPVGELLIRSGWAGVAPDLALASQQMTRERPSRRTSRPRVVPGPARVDTPVSADDPAPGTGA